jgi:3-deoxy-D-manno-octulosonic-acid transferase
MGLFFYLYRCLFFPMLLLGFRLLAPFQPKIRQGLKLRASNENQVPPWLVDRAGENPIWIHCASGEFEYAKPVIREIKARDPRIPVLVTFFSPSIANSVLQFEGIDFGCPLPWDRAADMDAFLIHHRPRCLLIARTDTWPIMVAQARQHGVPSLLFSATLSQTSGRARGLGRWASRHVFEQLDTIFCVTSEDQKVFAQLGFAKKTQVMGDTRYDQVQARLASPRPLREELFAQSMGQRRPILVAGSTWPEDEDVLLEVIEKCHQRVRFVVAPHEPTDTHLLDLESRLNKSGITSVRYEKTKDWPIDSVLLIDRVGILAELYGKASMAFVGGSFRKTVHSVMEPLAAGCLTFVGPLHLNNREAIEFRRIPTGDADLNCVERVLNPTAFVHRLEKALSSLSDEGRGRIQEEIAARGGQSKKVADWALAQQTN